MVTKIFDVVKESVIGSAGVTGSVIGDVADKMKTSFDEGLEYLGDLSKEISGMLTKLVQDFWENYNYAMGYVTKNIA